MSTPGTSVRAGPPADAPDPLTELRLSYAESLPTRLRALDRAIRAWRRAPEDSAALEKAEKLAHRLRGTTGSYGFADVSAAMGAVEDALRGARDRHETSASAIEPALGAARTFAAEAIARLKHKGVTA